MIVVNIPYNIRWNFSWHHWLSKQEFIETEKTLNAAPCKLLNSNKSYILRFLKYFRTRRTYRTSYKHLPVEWRGADFLKQNYWDLWFFVTDCGLWFQGKGVAYTPLSLISSETSTSAYVFLTILPTLSEKLQKFTRFLELLRIAVLDSCITFTMFVSMAMGAGNYAYYQYHIRFR